MYVAHTAIYTISDATYVTQTVTYVMCYAMHVTFHAIYEAARRGVDNHPRVYCPLRAACLRYMSLAECAIHVTSAQNVLRIPQYTPLFMQYTSRVKPTSRPLPAHTPPLVLHLCRNIRHVQRDIRGLLRKIRGSCRDGPSA